MDRKFLNVTGLRHDPVTPADAHSPPATLPTWLAGGVSLNPARASPSGVPAPVDIWVGSDALDQLGERMADLRRAAALTDLAHLQAHPAGPAENKPNQ